MSELNCRSCYAATLSKYDRARFWDEPIVSAVHYCPEHQAVQDRINESIDWSKVTFTNPNHQEQR